MQLVNRNIHIIKNTYVNYAMHAHDSLIILCEAYPWNSLRGLPSSSMHMLNDLLFILYNLLFANYAFFKTINQSICSFPNFE
jgi:hypothetical protein